MPTHPRLLVVMRHATAEPRATSDERRALTEGGRGDAAVAGRWLVRQGIDPDRVLVSAADRAVQTWEAVAEAAGWSIDADLDPGLYSAGTDTVLDLVRGTDDAHRSVLVIGHNPTMASLAQLLDNGDGDVGAGNRMATGFPPGAVAVLAVEGAWPDLDRARLVAFHAARS